MHIAKCRYYNLHMSRICVLTGDLVESSKLSARALDAALQAVSTAFDALAGIIGPAELARARGDGWQIALSETRFQCRMALMVRAHLRREGAGLSTRIALAEGAGEIPASGDLNSAHGPTFTASGQLLDRLEGPRIAHAGGGALGAALRLFDHVSEGWTPAQARALSVMLRPEPPTQSAAAQELGIARQSLAQALQAGGYDAISEALDMLERPGGAP